MDAKDNSPQVIVEVPTERNFSPFPTTDHGSKMEQFRRGWVDALALPDNLSDLIYDVTASLVIPALITSAWGSFPLPGFIRFGALVTVVIAAAVLWQLLEIPEVKGVLVFRLVLLIIGVILGF